MKLNLKFLALASIGSMLFASGCNNPKLNSSISTKTNAATVVCNDVSAVQKDSKPINIEDGGITSLPKNTLRTFDFVDNKNLIVLLNENKDPKEKICLYNIETKQLKEICKGNHVCFESLSGNKEKILYSILKDGSYVYDIEKNNSKKITDNDYDVTFSDPNGRYIISSNPAGFQSFDTETGKTKTCSAGSGQLEFCLSDGKYLPNNKFYFEGSIDKRIGIYSLDLTNMDKIEPVFLLSKKDNCHISQFDFINNNKSIIFAGDYKKQPGIYIYDLESEALKKVASGLTNQPEGSRGIFYNLSNDKTKIIFESFVNNNLYSSVYLAQIGKNSLISKKCLYKKRPETFAVLSISSFWSADDSFFLIDENEVNPSQPNQIFDKLRKFNIKNSK